MNNEKVKKLKWTEPALESLTDYRITHGLDCNSGSNATDTCNIGVFAGVNCTNGTTAAFCNTGGSALTHP